MLTPPARNLAALTRLPAAARVEERNPICGDVRMFGMPTIFARRSSCGIHRQPPSLGVLALQHQRCLHPVRRERIDMSGKRIPRHTSARGLKLSGEDRFSRRAFADRVGGDADRARCRFEALAERQDREQTLAT
jgi:hypothetical protein